MSNVKWPEETWLETERFSVNGTEVVHEKGQPLPDTLAKSLRAIRREAPEFWAVLEKLNMRFYHQPSSLTMELYAHGKLSIKQSKPHAQSESWAHLAEA